METIAKHKVDLDAAPNVGLGSCFSVKTHKKGGLWEFDSLKTSLHLTGQQKEGANKGYVIQTELEAFQVLNANILDYLLDYSEFIPKHWKKAGRICFWGTIFTNPTLGDCIRVLFWNGLIWDWEFYSLSSYFDSKCPAVVLIN